MSVNITSEYIKKAEFFIKETKKNNGLSPVDLDVFWKDQEKAMADPFGKDIPQLPLGAILYWECVCDELGITEDKKRFNYDLPWRMDIIKKYNDKAECIVGKRILGEEILPKK
ncbi:MAG: hypothetical protein A2096_06040 [Spirochaetes bacterium GWF1_41_5]|nr:MAG: hypothetical protein A2096_06040 [Spirochaetes bacterium GWF1_41_5]HBE03058.1 hypothetical protein [Spirochaetia bacterium]